MATHPSRASNVKVPYLVEALVDLADTTASATTAAISIPAETMILGAGLEVLTAMTGTSTDATVTVKVGSTSYTSALDIDAATAGAYTVSAALTPFVATSADTVDVVFNGFTGTITGGEVRVFALVVDVSNAAKPGLALLKS